MNSRKGSQESFTSCHSSPSNNEQQTRTNSRIINDEQHILVVSNLKGSGKVIQLRDLFYVFNLNARSENDRPDYIDNVVDIRFLTDFALIKMLTKEAACRAKSALDESWLFDKFIKVEWASFSQCNLLQSNNKPPLAQVFRRRDAIAKSSNRPRYRRGSVPAGRDIDNAGDVDDIKAQLAYYATNLPSKRTRFLRPGNGFNEIQNLNYVRHYSSNHQSTQQKQTPNNSPGCSQKQNLNFNLSPNKRFINYVCTRKVTRDRMPPSPVLEIEGLEYSGDLRNNILARTDMITLFTFCGVVKDIDIGFCKQENIVEKCYGSCKHRALVQMETIEQATRAINEFDHSWQMGRFLYVTYALEQSIERDRNINRRDRYSHKRFV